jgi:hypothetical protein
MIGSRRCGDHRSPVLQQRLDAIQNGGPYRGTSPLPATSCRISGLIFSIVSPCFWPNRAGVWQKVVDLA